MSRFLYGPPPGMFIERYVSEQRAEEREKRFREQYPDRQKVDPNELGRYPSAGDKQRHSPPPFQGSASG